MITKDYAMAYTEVIEILKYVPDEDVNKIPKEKIEFYKKNMDNLYDYKIDINKSFEEQEISEITQAILANIFRDYWATTYQKERIKAKEKYDLEKLEEEKREKYNPDDLFKKDETKENEVNDVDENSNDNLEYNSDNLPVVVKKENFFNKLISFIKGLFSKKK